MVSLVGCDYHDEDNISLSSILQASPCSVSLRAVFRSTMVCLDTIRHISFKWNCTIPVVRCQFADGLCYVVVLTSILSTARIRRMASMWRLALLWWLYILIHPTVVQMFVVLSFSSLCSITEIPSKSFPPHIVLWKFIPTSVVDLFEKDATIYSYKDCILFMDYTMVNKLGMARKLMTIRVPIRSSINI